MCMLEHMVCNQHARSGVKAETIRAKQTVSAPYWITTVELTDGAGQPHVMSAIHQTPFSVRQLETRLCGALIRQTESAIARVLIDDYERLPLLTMNAQLKTQADALFQSCTQMIANEPRQDGRIAALEQQVELLMREVHLMKTVTGEKDSSRESAHASPAANKRSMLERLYGVGALESAAAVPLSDLQ